MTSIPFIYAGSGGSRDLQIGYTPYTDISQLPVPIPPEFADDFTGFIRINNVDVFRENRFTVKNYAFDELLDVDVFGNTFVAGTFTVKGNQIKSSSGDTAIQLSGNDTSLLGHLSVTGIISSPSGTNNIANNVAVTGNVAISGTMSAAVKAFDITHPSDPTKRLRHGTLEGPEHSVFARGVSNASMLPLPKYWKDLVDMSTITVLLTPTSDDQTVSYGHLSVLDDPPSIYIVNSRPWIPYHYMVIATRKDVPPIEVEYEA